MSSPPPLARAAALHREGRLDAAATICEAVLKHNPADGAALNLLGVIRAGQNSFALAVDLFKRAVALAPRSVAANRNLAVAATKLGRHGEAADAWRRILGVEPTNRAAQIALGAALETLGRHAEAVDAFQAAVLAEPEDAAAQHRLATALARTQRLDDAVAAFRRTLELAPGDVVAHLRLGSVLARLDRHAEAADSFDAAARLDSTNAEAWHRLGLTLRRLGRTAEACDAFQHAVAVRPQFEAAQFNLGNALAALGRHADAAERFRAAVALAPGHAEAWNNLGIGLAALDDLDGAVAAYERAVEAKPDHAGAHSNLGHALARAGKLDAALASYGRACELRPDLVFALVGRGDALFRLGRVPEALAAYEQALAHAPAHAHALNMRVHMKRQICDWRDHERIEAALRDRIAAGTWTERPSPPLFDDPALQLSAARQWWQSRKAEIVPLARAPRRVPAGRLRIGYLSADFYQHATAVLMAGMFEAHDRARFEVIAFSIGGGQDGAMRQRLVKAFDRMVAIAPGAIRQSAQAIAGAGIDILVDLAGHLHVDALEILAHRPAPVQVHYLGCPNTLGTDCVDYMLVDRVIVPPDQQVNFSERLVHLPGSYQVNDRKRAISAARLTRHDYGLPDDALVFCCFNQSYKIRPEIFDIWMRLLRGVPQAVLWLLADRDAAAVNLRREAAARGVAPERLIFSRPESLDRHLARLRLADLFLDTLPVNAHTTASDALWAGLPVLTCPGRSFVARVAASLLMDVGLAELVTPDLDSYEKLALHLATHPAELRALRLRLGDLIGRAPLFDTERTTRFIEAAYRQMWDIHARGEPPRGFAIG